jgi:hypothetical protein
MTRLDSLLEWTATALIVVSAMLTAMNVVPTNMVFSFIGSILFLVWSIRIRKLSLVTINITFIAIYGVGIFLN